ncbi:hypothetical protein FNW52_04905 [Flavobacterium sp. ZT3R18]|uniref:hypothetical protein n=1 Tax=Flavobacterium sp. ZT3R18 TaxID=2594429 RepID=UPI00117B537B|nr:hypothetical protein [Flavobacterium sp. ZT3R18]TRX37305.1 hypothetical protein FNW52_04905 [Flavobacterium sp. ZT3R18]
MKITFTLTKKILTLGLLIFNLNNAIAQTDVNINKEWMSTPKEVNKTDDVKIIFDKTQVSNYKICYVNSMYFKKHELKKTDEGVKSYVTITKDILNKQKDTLSIIICDNQDKLLEKISIPFSKENSISATTNNATQENKTITLDKPTGYAFEDAKLLQEAIQKKDKNKTNEILNKYNIKIDIKKTINSIDFNGNEFFNQNESLKSVLFLTDKEINTQGGGGISMLLGKSISGLDVTKYANAMAEVMIKHAKEELTVAFFNKFKNFIKDNEEFKILFPKTSEVVSTLLSYKYPEMLPTLRNNFLDDLRKITFKIDDVLLLPKYNELVKNYPEITVIVRSMRLIHQLETGGLNAIGVLHQLSAFKEWDAPENQTKYKFKNVGSALKIANLISESICHKDLEELKWQNPKELVKLFEDEELFKIYLGLLYEKSRDIKFYEKNGNKNFNDILVTQIDNVFFFQNKIQEFVDITAKTQNIVNEIKSKKEDQIKITNDEYYTYISTSIDVIEYGFSLYNHFDDSFEVSDDLIKLMRLGNDLHKNIYEEKYNAAIINTMDIFSKINEISSNNIIGTKFKENTPDNIKNESKKILEKLEKNETVSNSEIDKLISNLNEAEIKNTKAYLYQLKLNNLFNFAQKAKPYALFMANMVEAKTEADIKAAFDAVILPVGSSSIKKHSDFNFNIQSYLGARYSFTDPKNNAQSTWNDRVAISAPIGLSISYGLNNNWGSISLFAPLLDLGAIVDYKLEYENEGTPDETLESKDYTIELGQIFSPGAYIVYGIGANIPISIGIGGQYGPGLSRINDDKSTQVNNPYWKWNAFLSVDIPLFNFVNYPKFKK